MSANLSNWREAPHNIWSFQNVNKIVDTRIIKKGSQTSPLSSEPVDFNDFRITLPEKPSLDLPTFLSSTETDGLVVLKDGKIVYEHYDRSNNENSVHIMMSMTKSIVGLVAGHFVEQGKLDVDATVSHYVSEMKGTSYESVTVRQCLDMRVPIKHDDASPKYRKSSGWVPFEEGEKQTDLHDFLSEFTVVEKPAVDGQFEYVSVNTDLMGWVLERVSGKKFADLVSELIWQPMGAESDAYITVDSSGNARTAGGMCATVRDIARVGQLVLDDENGVVPASWIHDMLDNGSQEAFSAGLWKRGFDKVFDSMAYRSYWLGDRNSQTLAGIGIHGQMLVADRKNKVVMAKTSSQPDRTDPKKSALTLAAFCEFQRILTGKSANGVQE